MNISLEVTIVISIEDDGYYMATCKELPEFITGGDSLGEVIENLPDALIVTVEAYRHINRPFPKEAIAKRQFPKLLLNTLTPKGKPKKDSDNLWFRASIPTEDYGFQAL